MHGKPPADEEALKLLYERATLPDLIIWLERNKDRAADLQPDEVQELLAMQSSDGPLAKMGVDNCVDLIERRRMLVRQVREIAGTEYIDLLEGLVRLIFDKVKPGRRG